MNTQYGFIRNTDVTEIAIGADNSQLSLSWQQPLTEAASAWIEIKFDVRSIPGSKYLIRRMICKNPYSGEVRR